MLIDNAGVALPDDLTDPAVLSKVDCVTWLV
jgi:hypothetical protein